MSNFVLTPSEDREELGHANESEETADCGKERKEELERL